MLEEVVQFSSVAQSCPTLCDPMNRSTPGLPVHHQLLEFAQTHVHRVSDAIQPSHPLSSPSPPPETHICIFKTEGCLCVVVVGLFSVSLLVFCEYKNYYMDQFFLMKDLGNFRVCFSSSLFLSFFLFPFSLFCNLSWPSCKTGQNCMLSISSL